MSDHLSRRRLIAAGALGTLGMTGCAASVHEGQGMVPPGEGDDPPQEWLSYEDLWPERLDPAAPPKRGYSRAARAYFRLADLWKNDRRYDEGKRKPTARMLAGFIEDAAMIEDVPMNKPVSQEPLFPAGSEAARQFERLWSRLRETAQAWLMLGGVRDPERWRYAPPAAPEAAARIMAMVSSLQPPPREREALTPTEKREIEQAILTLDDDDEAP